MKSKTCFYFTFLFIIFGVIICQNIQAAVTTVDMLKARANILTNKVNLCKSDIWHGAPDCKVIVNWENNRRVSISEAENLATQYLKEAQEGNDFDSILNDPNRRSKFVNAPYSNDQNARSAYEYGKVLAQFKVEKSKRYEKDNYTYCNIFVWDVTRAMGSEIPHWSKEGTEMKVYKLVEWLQVEGKERGWRLVSLSYAQQMANDGHPTIAIWKKPDNSEGHVSIVRPGSVDWPEAPAITQAGDPVLNANHLNAAFGPDKIKEVKFWFHE